LSGNSIWFGEEIQILVWSPVTTYHILDPFTMKASDGNDEKMERMNISKKGFFIFNNSKIWWKMEHLLIMTKCSISYNCLNSFPIQRSQNMYQKSKQVRVNTL